MSSEVPGRWGHAAAPVGSRLPGMTIAAAASLGAGAVHAAAAGVHAEHPELARIFVVLAAAQLAAGVAVLVRPRKLLCWLLASVNTVAVAGWLLSRVTGISWIDGLQTRESPQFADTACAALGAIALGTAVAAALIGWQRMPSSRPSVAAFPVLAVAALALPAMLLGGTHVHDHSTAGAAHDHTTVTAEATGVTGVATVDTAQAHEHDPTGGVTSTTFDENQPHEHDANGNPVAVAPASTDAVAADGTPTRPWPRAWDPTQPIDVAGVAAVTTDQEGRAIALIQGTLDDLPRYADPNVALAAGYSSIGDAATGTEHYIKSSLIQDVDMLDPEAPESLLYHVDGDKRTLAGAMYIVSSRPLDDSSLTSYAGSLMTWHEHNNLCWGVGADGSPKVVGLTDADGNCARGVKAGGDTPMVHVWIVPQPCGVFSALEGVGAGNAAVPENQRTDTCAAIHDHGTATTPTTTSATTTPVATPATAAVASRAYDPSKPIDLSGVAGVTPEQQAYAENLVAINVVRLPQWADYRTAEAAGFRSIGDAGTGFEHFVHWDWIDDQDTLDPDHPESLVYAPQPDGSKRLVSAMYMLPDTVPLPEVPNTGGALMQWHIHDNLCFTTDPVAPQVAGITGADGSCRAGLRTFPSAPMIHVWIVPNACGPFAALEGIGAGQVAAGQTAHCDHVHGDGLLG